jgi:hypothetical protein
MKQSSDLAGGGVNASDVWTFVAIAIKTSQRQIVLDSCSTMFARSHGRSRMALRKARAAADNIRNVPLRAAI